ncbi:protein mono-ADP-ribosyltransferase PARP12-like isoform X2 [Ascaphus truei]|uniref:protein mono-ADP-ribosyltransferase PARP12-like isoform X2 n=1 Tax=Ascaphus truei TaxID=8439 RepID=UPI003F5A7925
MGSMAETCIENESLEEGELQEERLEEGEIEEEFEKDEEKERDRRRDTGRQKRDPEKSEAIEKETKRRKRESRSESHAEKRRERGKERKDRRKEKKTDKNGDARDRKRNGKCGAQHHSRDRQAISAEAELGVMPDYSALSLRARRLLCSSGGSMELGQLGRSLGLDAQQVEKLVEEENGRSLMLHVQEEARVAVSRSAVRVCTDRKQKCGGTCERLHLCRYHVLGSCSRTPCTFSHDIQSGQNLQLLQMYELEGLTMDELRQLLLQNDPSFLPEVCAHYNRGDGLYGSCTFKSSCQKLHTCQYFLNGNCKYRNKCKRSHILNNEETLKKLHKWGVKDNLVLTLQCIYRNASVLRDNTIPLPKKKAATSVKRENCDRVHNHSTYKWQNPLRSQSVDSKDKEYCNANGMIQTIVSDPDTMTSKSNKVRHLYAPSGDSKPAHFIFTKNWLSTWYWREGFNKWIEYGQESTFHKAANVCSSELEKAYLSGERATLQFKVGRETYELRFKDMVQRNLRTGAVRRVDRKHTLEVKRKKTRKPDSSQEDKKSIPPHCDRARLPKVDYKLIVLSQTSEEYKQVKDLFHSTLRTVSILSIERVHNPALTQAYQRRSR